MKKNEFPFLEKKLKFVKKTHEYFYNNIKFESVTQWLGQYEEPFDSIKISEVVSKNKNSEYFGINPKDIRKLWAQTSIRGTKKHKAIENWLNNKTSSCSEEGFLRSLNIIPDNSYPEIPLLSKKLMLSGTADIVSIINSDIYIWDIKTTKKVNEDTIKKFSLQILTYCLLLKHMLRDFNKNLKVYPGGIILIQPINNISQKKFEGFEAPILIDIDKNVGDDLKMRIYDRFFMLNKNLKK